MAGKKAEDAEISVLKIEQGVVEFCILGTSPLIMHRMAQKARGELLLPKGRKDAATRAATLKHNPVEEYRDAAHSFSDRDAGETRLFVPAPAFKGAIAAAALDMPGARKTEIGRLTWVEGYSVSVWGRPELLMSVVRQADINHTPDIRTRPILPEWACRLRVRFVKPRMTQTAVANLLAAAGVIIGVGDFRQEKGKGSFGQFELVSADNPDFVRITSEQGKAVQDDGMAHPVAHDQDTEELLSWFSGEVVKLRGGNKGKEAA